MDVEKQAGAVLLLCLLSGSMASKESKPLNLADMDMTRYGKLRGMNASVSSKEA